MADDFVVRAGGDISDFESALARMPGIAQDTGAAVNRALAETGGADSMITAINQVAAGMGSLAPVAQQVASAYQNYVAALAEATNGTLSQEAAAQRLTAATADLQASLMAYEQASQAASRSTADIGRELSSLGSDLVTAGTALTALAAPFALLGKASLETAGYFEQSTIAMTTLLHSGEAAQKMMADLTEFSLKTPFEIKGLVDASRQMLGMGTAADDLIPRLRTLGDAAAALGLGDAGVKRLALAFGEMQTRGVVAMKELNQMAMAGIPAMEILAKALDTTVADVMHRVHARSIDAATAIPILLEGLNARFGGMMAAQSQTYLGLLSNVKDALTKTLRTVGDEMLPMARSAAAALFPILEGVSGLAKQFGALPAPVREFALIVGTAAAASGPLLLTLGGLLTAAGKLMEVMGALGLRTTATAAATTALAGAQTAATATTEGLAAATTTQATAAASAEAATLGFGSAARTAASALQTLGPLLQVAAYVVLAEKVYELARAYQQLRSARQDLDQVSRESEDALAKLEIQMRQQGINIDELSRQYHSGEITVEAYRRGLLELAKAYREANPYVEDAAAKQDRLGVEVKKAAEAIAAGTKAANEQLEIAKAVLEQYREKVAAGTASQAELTRAQQAYDKALKDANPTLKGHVADLGELQRKSAEAAREYDAAAKTYAAAVRGLADGKVSIDVVKDAWAQLSKTAKAAGADLFDVNRAAGEAQEKAAKQIEAIARLAETYGVLRETAGSSATSQLALAETWSQLEKAAKALGVEVRAVGDGFIVDLVDKSGKASDAVKALADQLRSLLPAADGVVTVNGRVVPTLEALSRESRAAGNAALSAAAGTRTYTEALDDLQSTMVFMNGEWIKAADLIKNLASSYDGLTDSARAAASALEAAQAAGSERNRADDRAWSAPTTGNIDLASWAAAVLAASKSPATSGNVSIGAASAAQQILDKLFPELITNSFRIVGKYRFDDELQKWVRVTAAATDAVKALGQAAEKASGSVADLTQTITPNLENIANWDLSGVTTDLQALVTAGGAAASGLTGLAAAVNPLAKTITDTQAVVRTSMQAMAAEVATLTNPQLASQQVTPGVAGSAPARGLPPMAVTVQVQAGVVAGQNGMQQLASIVGDRVIETLKLNVGLKV